MLKTYNDIITLSKSRTVYNIREEGPDDWKTFIANDQFNSLLDKTIKAVFNNDPDNHKPIWIAGTYGTGKSHAGAVLQHLLCDSKESIQDYIDVEYGDSKYDILRTNLISLRQQKRLFPVKLYGQQSITFESDLSLQLQSEIKGALKEAGIHIVVKTDFDSYVEHIDQHPEMWELLLSKSVKLRSVAPDLKKLRSELVNASIDVFDSVNEALRESRLNINLENKDLVKWIIEVQNKLREGGVYNGLLIIWDEFTNICKSAIGESLLGKLQEVSEAMMSDQNDSYFLFISHPSALNLLNEEKRSQTIGRYHYVTYNMEPVSAFKIMSRKLQIVNSDAHAELVNNFYHKYADLLEIFSASSNQKEETKNDLQKLYPIHPSTANLATYYAREAGSSSRSVFEFLACDAVREFFTNETAYRNYATITPDFLWDYVMGAFNEDQTKFGAVLERYNSYHTVVEREGNEYEAVFKGILLLNALNNIAGNDTVTPSEQNIKNLFIGTDVSPIIDDILNFFNDKSIIQRLPGDVFSIQFTALPADEIEKIKNELMLGTFKFTDQVAKFADTAIIEFNKNWVNIFRPFKLEVYSQQSNEYTLINKIENGQKQAKGYELFIAVLLARNFDELNFLKAFAHRESSNSKFKNVLLVVIDKTLDQPNYTRFIDFMANSTCAQRHGLAKQQETYSNNAKKLVKDWVAGIRGGNFTYYINGKEDAAPVMKFVSTVNNCVAPEVFSCGPESLFMLQTRSTKTNWQKSSVKSTVDAILQFNTKEEVLAKIQGQGKHVDLLFQDSVDQNMELKSDVDPKHPVKLVCDYIEGVFKKTHKNQEFNLGEKLESLSYPPYGLYQSYAGMSMVAYAMRKYVKQIFDTSGKPRESRHIVDDVVELFKSWENGKKSNKLNLMFESKESSDLCKRFISIFKLRSLPGYKDVTSLTDARWAILEYANQKGYPLWSVKYNNSCTDEIAILIDNIVKVCDPNGLADQDLIGVTSKAIKKLELELSIFLVDAPRIFKEGFVTFIKKDDIVKVQDEEVEDVYDYLTKHLHSEIGRWTVEEVKDQVKNWRLEKTLSSRSQNTNASQNGSYDNDNNQDSYEITHENGNNSNAGDGFTAPWNALSNGNSSQSSLTLRNEAKKCVQELDANTLKQAIETLCENESDQILTVLLKYVQKA